MAAATPRELPAQLSTQQILSLSARDVRQLFDNGTLTIPGLLSRVLLQINNENEHGLKLRAILSLAPEQQLQARAQELDQELQSGQSRGPLHGIPIVLKVLNSYHLPRIFASLAHHSRLGLYCNCPGLWNADNCWQLRSVQGHQGNQERPHRGEGMNIESHQGRWTEYMLILAAY